ncbi:hypothetical protein PENTCL1PPCAC_26031, partial [Pristionchus entomophagus]
VNRADEDPLGFSDLPDDIIRLIIRAEGHSFTTMRLISSRWSRLVLEHLKRQSNNLTLNKVILAVDEKKETMRMHAVFDESLKYNYGGSLGDWIESKTSQDTTWEVLSTPCILKVKEEVWIALFVLWGFVITVLIPLLIERQKLVVYRMHLTVFGLLIGLINGFVFFYSWKKRKTVQQNMIRLFSCTRKIETLVLNGLSDEMLELFRSTIGNLKIDYIELHGQISGEQQNQLLLHIARECGLKRVFVSKYKGYERFVDELARLNVHVSYK